MSIIAIIPARSGSKGLKDKNIKELNGKPLMAYTIEAALESGIFDTVHVSTDSESYAEIAKKYGADVPFLRSKEMSSDTASSWDTVKEVLHNYKKLGKEFSECMLLQPTSPLRDSNDIKDAYDVFKLRSADSMVSVCEVDHPVQWCFSLGDDLSMGYYSRNPYKNMRRQELDKKYRNNGAIYILKTKKFENTQFDFYDGNCFAYIMSREKSIDIDDTSDFRYAEFIIMGGERNLNKYIMYSPLRSCA